MLLQSPPSSVCYWALVLVAIAGCGDSDAANGSLGLDGSDDGAAAADASGESSASGGETGRGGADATTSTGATTSATLTTGGATTGGATTGGATTGSTAIMTTADPDTGVAEDGGSTTGDVFESFADPNGIIIYADQPTMPQIEAANPGDTLLFEPGEHDRVDIEGFISTECDPLVLASLDENNPAIIHNTTNPGWEALDIENSEYVVVENLIIEGGITGIEVESSDHVIIWRTEIRNINQAGFKAKSNSNYVDFIDNVIHNTGLTAPQYGEGIYLGTAAAQDPNDRTNYIWMEGNEIYNTGYGEAIDLKGGVRFSTVRNNHIHDIAPGIAGGQTNEAAIVMGYSSDEPANNWVEFNLVEDVNWGMGGEPGRPNVGASGIAVFGGGNYVHSNTVRNCLEYGIYFNAYGDPGYFVYAWGNEVTNSGYSDVHDAGLDNLMMTDPGMENPNRRQQWCQ